MARVATVLWLGTLALLPLQLPPVAPGLHPGLQWSDLLLAAAFPLWLASRRRAPRGPGVYLALGVYLGSAALAWLISAAPDRGSLLKLLGIASLVALATQTAAASRDPRGGRLAGRAIALAAALASVTALTAVLLFVAGVHSPFLGGHGDLVPGDYPRARGVFGHPNGLASFAIAAAGLIASPRAALPTALVRMLRVLLVLATLATLSRGVLGLAVALAIAGASTPRRRVVAVAVTLGALSLLVPLSLGNLALDPTRPWEARWRDELSPRRQALVSGAQTLWQHPFGIGPGALPASVDGLPFEAHNTPLNVAATLGLPAVSALLVLPLLLWRRRGRPTDRAAWGALAGLALDGLTQDVEDFRHVWLLLGWLWADAERAERS